jgi:hypothetical protein
MSIKTYPISFASIENGNFCKKVEELKTDLKSAQKYNELLTKLEEEI